MREKPPMEQSRRFSGYIGSLRFQVIFVIKASIFQPYIAKIRLIQRFLRNR